MADTFDATGARFYGGQPAGVLRITADGRHLDLTGCRIYTPAFRGDRDWPGHAIDRIAELETENTRLREAAEDAYAAWSCGEPLDREMREVGRAIGFKIDPA